MVTAKEMIEALKKLDPATVVILASDPEWNGLAPAAKAYTPGFYGNGEFRSVGDIIDGEDKPKRAKVAVVFSPEY